MERDFCAINDSEDNQLSVDASGHYDRNISFVTDLLIISWKKVFNNYNLGCNIFKTILLQIICMF